MPRREWEQHHQQQNTAAAAAAGAEAGDSPARNCGTAAVVSTAAAIRQEEEYTQHWHWLGEVMTTESRFLIFRNKRSSHHQQQQQQHQRRHYHSSTTAVEQYAPTNPQRQDSSMAEAGWDFQIHTILHLSGESASSPWERLFMPPARGDGSRRPLCCREHRGLMCGAGVARACGH